MTTIVPSFARLREKDVLFQKTKDVVINSSDTSHQHGRSCEKNSSYYPNRHSTYQNNKHWNLNINSELPSILVQSSEEIKPTAITNIKNCSIAGSMRPTYSTPSSVNCSPRPSCSDYHTSQNYRKANKSNQIYEKLSREIRPLKRHTAETFRETLISNLNCEISLVNATRLMHRVEKADDRNELTIDNLRNIIQTNSNIIFCGMFDKKGHEIAAESCPSSATVASESLEKSIPHFMLPKRNSSTKSSFTNNNIVTSDNTTSFKMTSNYFVNSDLMRNNCSVSGSKQNSIHITKKIPIIAEELVKEQKHVEQIESSEKENDLEVAGQLLIDVGNTFQSYSSHTHEFSNGTTIQLLTKYDYKIILTQLGFHDDGTLRSKCPQPISDSQLDRLVTFYRNETSQKFNISDAPGVDFENFCQSLIDIATYLEYEPMEVLKEVASIMPAKPFNVVVNDLSSDKSDQGSDKGESIKEDISGVIVEVPNLLDNAERRSTMPLSALSSEDRARLIKEKMERKRERARIRQARLERKQIRQQEEIDARMNKVSYV